MRLVNLEVSPVVPKPRKTKSKYACRRSDLEGDLPRCLPTSHARCYCRTEPLYFASIWQPNHSVRTRTLLEVPEEFLCRYLTVPEKYKKYQFVCACGSSCVPELCPHPSGSRSLSMKKAYTLRISSENDATPSSTRTCSAILNGDSLMHPLSRQSWKTDKNITPAPSVALPMNPGPKLLADTAVPSVAAPTNPGQTLLADPQAIPRPLLRRDRVGSSARRKCAG